MFVPQRTGRQKDTSSASNRFGSEAKANQYLICCVECHRRATKYLSAKFLGRIAYTFFPLPYHPSIIQYSVIKFLSLLLSTSELKLTNT